MTKSPQASEDEKSYFQGRGHKDISDDLHLYELARAVKATVLVTQDQNQLRHPRREEIERSFGVELYEPEELLALAEKEEAQATQKAQAIPPKEDWKEGIEEYLEEGQEP